jgi:glycosyltransferase involved in cell wall biosynthesis
MSSKPLISVLTPVYNGGAYLAEAIESVLRQSYDHWEYVIVNNRSTDETLAICESYVRADSRIRVVTNDEFVDCESNHNNAFRQISPESRYCKVVSADDWLLPGALSRFVEFAAEHPTAGIIGSYQQSGDAIRWKGIPADVELLSGRDACRLALINEIHVFGTPTSVLYRSDLVRRVHSFFPHTRPHADSSACFASLSDCDLGFIHEVLSVERVHDNRLSSDVEFFDAGNLALLESLLDYGPTYLSEAEMNERLSAVEAKYYRCVARGLLKLKGRRYLRFHDAAMQQLSMRLDNRRIVWSALGLLMTKLLRNTPSA